MTDRTDPLIGVVDAFNLSVDQPSELTPDTVQESLRETIRRHATDRQSRQLQITAAAQQPMSHAPTAIGYTVRSQHDDSVLVLESELPSRHVRQQNGLLIAIAKALLTALDHGGTELTVITPQDQSHQGLKPWYMPWIRSPDQPQTDVSQVLSEMLHALRQQFDVVDFESRSVARLNEPVALAKRARRTASP